MDLNDEDKNLDRDQKLKDIFDESREKNTLIKASSLNLPYLDLRKISIEPVALELVDEEVSRNALIVPFQKQGEDIAVGVFDSLNPETIKVISKLQDDNFRVKIYIVSKNSLDVA